ncbi:metallophosphoesterase [Nanoarchaeota archaeon]
MKVCVFSDLHSSFKSLKSVEKLGKKSDIIVCAGDISMFESRLRDILSRLNRIKKPVYIIPGNHEREGNLRKLCKNYRYIRYLHGRVFIIDELVLIGFNTSGFSFIDEDFEKFMKHQKKRLKKFKDKKIVLVSHSPPNKTKLDKIGKEHVGNKSVRRFINEYKPKFVICGHIHENAGKKDKIRKTVIINPGNKGKIIDI